MFKKTLLPALLPLIVGLGCKHSLYSVRPLPAHNDKPAKGIAYVLPKKTFVLEVDVKTTYTSFGEYVCYNGQLGFPEPKDGCDNGKPGKSTKHEVAATRLVERARPDESQRYVVQPKKSIPAVARGLEFELTEDGYLVSGAGDVVDHRADIVVGSIKSAASIAASAIGISTAGVGAAVPKLLSLDDADRTTKVDCPLDEGGSKKKGDPTHPVCAAALRLMVLTRKRDELITQEFKADVDPDLIAQTLKPLDVEINSLKALFFKSKITKTKTLRAPIDPIADPTGVVYCLQGGNKLVSSECKVGDGDSDDIIRKKKSKEIKVLYDASTTEAAAPQKPKDGQGEEGKGNEGEDWAWKVNSEAKEKGIVYRIPRELDIEVTVGGTQVSHATVLVPQLGTLAQLSSIVRGRKGSIVVSLGRSSGMLTKISLKEEANYTDIVDAIGTAGTTVLDATKGLVEAKTAKQVADEAAAKAEEDAKSAAEDPINVAKQKLELLKLEREIACYETLGGPCPDSEDSGTEE